MGIPSVEGGAGVSDRAVFTGGNIAVTLEELSLVAFGTCITLVPEAGAVWLGGKLSKVMCRSRNVGALGSESGGFTEDELADGLISGMGNTTAMRSADCESPS